MAPLVSANRAPRAITNHTVDRCMIVATSRSPTLHVYNDGVTAAAVFVSTIPLITGVHRPSCSSERVQKSDDVGRIKRDRINERQKCCDCNERAEPMNSPK